MNLTSAQTSTLVADINGQAGLATARSLHDTPFVAGFYNAAASPSAAVWRTNVRNTEIVAAVSTSSYIALTPQAQKGLDLYLVPDLCDASSSNVRGGFQAIFGAGATLSNLIAIAQRSGSRFEILLATSLGPPATCGVDADGNSLFGQQLDTETIRKVMEW